MVLRWFLVRQTIGTNGFAMFFGLATIGTNGFSMILAFSADKVALRVAADVVGVRFRSRLHLWVSVIHVCYDDIFGEAEEWAEKKADKGHGYHGSNESNITVTLPGFL